LRPFTPEDFLWIDFGESCETGDAGRGGHFVVRLKGSVSYHLEELQKVCIGHRPQIGVNLQQPPSTVP
jgi:hypothetical protein